MAQAAHARANVEAVGLAAVAPEAVPLRIDPGPAPLADDLHKGKRVLPFGLEQRAQGAHKELQQGAHGPAQHVADAAHRLLHLEARRHVLVREQVQDVALRDGVHHGQRERTLVARGADRVSARLHGLRRTTAAANRIICFKPNISEG